MTPALALPINLSVGTFDAYLNLVRQMPRLTIDQERELTLKFRDHGDLDAARDLVMSNLRFVVHVATGCSFGGAGCGSFVVNTEPSQVNPIEPAPNSSVKT